MEKGPLAGCKCQNVKATLYYGSFHAVDSDEMSFKLAASIAFKKGIVAAKPCLLEPIMHVEILVPNDYTGDVRTAALAAGNALEYWTKRAVAKCIAWWQKLQQAGRSYGEVLGAIIGAVGEKMFGSGGSWGDVWKEITNAYDSAMDEYEDRAEEIERIEDERTARFKRNYEDRAIAIQHFADAYGNAAITIDQRKKKDEASIELGKMTKVSNDLVMGGSNAALKMQILGPTYQSEQKKQTSLLEKIAANTEKTADNTEDTSDGYDMGVVN